LHFFDIFQARMPPTPASQLAYLGFQLVPPSPLLRPYVGSYWYFRRETALTTYREEYMHPRGGFGLIFNLGDPLRLDTQPITAPVFLDGANTVSRRLGFFGQVELIGVRFQEGGAYPFLGLPLKELRNATTLLEALDEAELLRLQQRLVEARSLSARINLMEEWLLGRLAQGKERQALIPASLARLRGSQGRLPISRLAQEFAISQRQLERLYQNQVGLSPKQYAQLLRVETARLALKQKQVASTTHLAAELGFSDQSHFIREFSAVVGLTPYAYLKRHRRQAEADAEADE
jgi:AraC-like DNA-binding protein